MSIYKSDGSPVREGEVYETIIDPEAAETYYLKVTAYSQYSPGGSYGISLEAIADDNNSDAEHATPWDLSQSLRGDLAYVGDADYFQFSAQAGQSYIFNQIYGLSARLYDSDGMTFLTGISDYDAKDDVQGYLNWTAPHDGVYYLKVSGLVLRRYVLSI